MREGGKGGTQRAAGKKMHARPPNIIGVIRFDSPGEESEGSGREGRKLSLLQQSFVGNERRSRREFRLLQPQLLQGQVLGQFLDAVCII